MAVMMGDLYDALRSAGAEDDKARKAAAEVAGFENRLASLDSRVSVLTWMVGFNLALTVAIVGKLFVGTH
jgi:hypothetical protein